MLPMKKAIAVLILFDFTNRLDSLDSPIPKMFKMDMIEPCADNMNANRSGHLINIRWSQNRYNVLSINGQINIERNTTGKIDFQASIVKCILGSDRCDVVSDNMKLQDICQYTNHTDWIRFNERIVPPIQCPLQSGIYEIQNNTLDMALFSYLPVDGFRWIMSLELVEILMESHQQNHIICSDIETTVTAVRQRKYRVRN